MSNTLEQEHQIHEPLPDQGMGRFLRRYTGLVSGVGRSSLHLFLTTVITSIFGYLYWLIAARLYSPQVVGHVSAFVSSMLLITSLGSMGIGLGLAYVLPHARERWAALVNTALLVVACVAAILGVVLLVAAARLHLDIQALSPLFTAVFVVSTTMWTVSFVVDQILTVERATGLVLVRNGMSSLLRLALLPAIHLLGPSYIIIGLFGIWGVSAVLSMCAVIVLFARRNPFDRRLQSHLDYRVLREIVPLSLGNHVLITTYMLPGLVLPLIVTTLLSSEANAYFYTAWMIATILFTIPTSTSSIMFVHGAVQQRISGHFINRILAMTLAAVVPLALLLIVAHTYILALFGPRYVRAGSGLLVALICTAIPMSVCSVYISAQRIRRNFKRAFGSAVAVALSCLTVVSLVVVHTGLIGIGEVVFLSYSLVAAGCLADLWLSGVRARRRSARATARELVSQPPIALAVSSIRHLNALPEGAEVKLDALSPERDLPPVVERRVSGRLLVLLQLYAPGLLVACAALLWILSLGRINVRAMSDLGLVSVLPVSFFAALVIIVAGFCLTLTQPRFSERLALLHVVILILILYATTALVEEQSRFSVTYRHLGFIEYIVRTGQSNGALDAYFNWPAFFVLSAFLTRIAGVQDLLGLTAWAPAIFNLLYVGPLVMLLRAGTRNRRRVWLGVWFFYLCNWIGQDYFSPQAFNFFLYLVILGILLMYFPVLRGAAPFAGRHLGAVLPVRLSGLLRPGATPQGYVTVGPAQRASLVGLVVILFAVSVASHQLTPFALLSSVTMLVVFNRCTLRTLPVTMLVMVATWISFMAVGYLSGHLGVVLQGMGSLHGAISANVTQRLHGSAEHAFIVNIRLALTLIVWVGAGVGAVRVLRRDSSAWAYVLLALAPFPLLAGQAYGGEMLLRVYLFALPAVVFFLAALFFAPARPDTMSWRTGAVGLMSWRTGAVGLASLFLLTGFTFARYGNERMDYMTNRDVQAVHQLYHVAPLGSLLVGLSNDIPWKYKDFELYHYATIDDLAPAQRARVYEQHDITPVLGVMRSLKSHPVYLIVTRSERAQMTLFYGMSAAQMRQLQQAVSQSPALRLIYDNGDAQIYALRGSAGHRHGGGH